MSEQNKLEQEIDRRAHAFADLSVGINGKNDTEDQKRLYWFGVRHGYSNGFSDAAEMHKHLMAEKDKRIERLREALKRCLHARQCNAPYGQMEKMPTVHELKTALQEETK